MKILFCLFALAGLALFHLNAQLAPAAPRLIGIMNKAERKVVFLDFGETRPSLPRPALLFEGERKEIADVEVLRINAERGTAEIRVAQTNIVLSLLDECSTAFARTNVIALTNAALKMVLELYSETSGRTVLQFPVLPNCALQVRAAPANRAEAAVVLELALATQGIAVIRDGEKFALVVPENVVRFVHARSTEIKHAAPDTSAPEIIATGGVIFEGADLEAVARLSAELRGRKINSRAWPVEIPRPNFFFKNRAPLTKPELIYALDTLLEWCGLKMVPDGDDLLKPELIRRK